MEGMPGPWPGCSFFSLQVWSPLQLNGRRLANRSSPAMHPVGRILPCNPKQAHLNTRCLRMIGVHPRHGLHLVLPWLGTTSLQRCRRHETWRVGSMPHWLGCLHLSTPATTLCTAGNNRDGKSGDIANKHRDSGSHSTRLSRLLGGWRCRADAQGPGANVPGKRTTIPSGRY